MKEALPQFLLFVLGPLFLGCYFLRAGLNKHLRRTRPDPEDLRPVIRSQAVDTLEQVVSLGLGVLFTGFALLMFALFYW